MGSKVLALAVITTFIAVILVGWLWLRHSRSSHFGRQEQEPASPQEIASAAAPSHADTAQAGVKSEAGQKAKLADFDARVTDARKPDADRAQAAAALRAKIPGVDVQFDRITGSPSHIIVTGKLLTDAARQAGDVYAPVRQFVNENAELFGHDATALNDSRVTRDDVTAHNGMRTVVWQQQVDGVPLYNTILKANITKDGSLVALGSHFMSDAVAATGMDAPQRAALLAQPLVDVKKAISLAAADLGDEVAPDQALTTSDPQGAERKQRFTAPKLSDTFAQLSWLPVSSDTAKLTWDVTLMSLKRREMFRVLVDAKTGEVLMRTSLTNDISNASYRVHANATNLTPLDSPTPFSPGHPTPSSAQPAEVARNLITLQAIDTTASPNGWINDGGTDTYGNNVDAHLDLSSTNPPYGTGTHATSATRVFDFTMDLTQAPGTYQSAAITELFYLCNWYHDKLYALGFTESAGNFQQNNFSRGGLGSDAVLADAQDGSGTNNANFSTPSDGSPGRMQMFVFTGPTPDRDGDLDAEIVIHEATHGLSNRLVGSGVGISALQPSGMGEGWSDFYGMTLLSEAGDNVNGNYAAGGYATYQLGGLTENYYYGIRRYPYSTDLTKNPLTLRDIDPGQASTHAGIPRSPIIGTTANEVHNMGEVWCVTLWEVRASLINKHGWTIGNQLVLQIVTDGMKLSPANPTFLQARDAIIQADLVNNAGANRNEIWAAFAKRGMGASATVPVNSTTTGVVEAYDLPDNLGVTPNAAFLSIGNAGGPFSPASQTYTLTNNGATALNWTGAKTQTWLTLSSVGGTLAAGASIAVTATINGAANTLIDGTYTDTVTFTNTSSGAVLARGVTLRVGVKDYFTELFSISGANDVSNQSFLFTPNASNSYYSVQRTPGTAFYTDPIGGTSLAMSDDTFVQVTPTGQQVKLYGTNYPSFYVGSNGYITFTAGDTSYDESFASHFNQPRISALFDDLLPTTGQVTWKQTADRVAVTWQGVSEYGATNSNSFQIEMFFDGRIRITCLGIAATDGLIGLSQGLGTPVDFVKSDFSTYPVINNVIHHYALSTIVSPQVKGVAFSITITAQDVNNVTVPSYAGTPGLSASGSGGAVSLSPTVTTAFSGGVWTGNVTVNVFDTNVILAVNDGAGHTGASNPFNVGTGPLHHFGWNAQPPTRAVNVPFNATVTAQDAGNNTVPTFAGAVNLSGYVGSGTGSLIAITEINPNTPDEIEFMNVTAAPVNISGWQIYIYDEDAVWPTPKTVFTIPAGTVCAAGQIFRLQEFGTAPGTFPQYFYGSNINWTSGSLSHVAVLVRDASGIPVDFVCAAAATPANITSPQTIPAAQWSGAPTTAPANTTYGYSRIGTSDGNVPADWTTATPGMGIANPGLTLPFPSAFTPVSITPAISGGFVNGVWTGSITVSQTASGMKLRADDGAAHTGDSNAFNVLVIPAPAAVTLAATAVTGTGATLHGTVNANGNATAVSFDYGGGISYGTNIPGIPSSVTGTSAASVSAPLAGLTPGTTYHFRVTGTNVGGPGNGGDLIFTTLSNDANLSGFTLSAGALSPAFASGTISYTANVPRAMTSMTVTPTTAASNATMTVNGAPATSGTAIVVNLTIGINTISTRVTAQDGVTVQTYTLAVIRRTHYQEWIVGLGLGAAAFDPQGDLNGNGVKNLLEWAFGTNPGLAGRSTIRVNGAVVVAHGTPALLSLEDFSGASTLYAMFARRKDAATVGLTYAVEFSADLSGWTVSTDPPFVVADDSEVEAAVVPFPVLVNGLIPHFFRVSVTAE